MSETDGKAGVVRDPGAEPGREPGGEPGREPGGEPGREPGGEPGREPGGEQKAEEELGAQGGLGSSALPEGISVRTRLSTLHGTGPGLRAGLATPSEPSEVGERCGVPTGLGELGPFELPLSDGSDFELPRVEAGASKSGGQESGARESGARKSGAPVVPGYGTPGFDIPDSEEAGVETDLGEDGEYLEMEVSKGRVAASSQLRTTSRSLPLDSLLMLAEFLPSGPDDPAYRWGDGMVDLAAPSDRGVSSSDLGASHLVRGASFSAAKASSSATGPPWAEDHEDAGTNVWDFVGHGGEDLSEDEGVIADRYRIAERLGAGGMAQIFRVEHLHLGKEFALKIIHPEMSYQPNMKRAFFREAQVASQLEHPNIVKITDFGVDDHRGAYIVMEYLRGDTLHTRISSEGRLRVAFALEVALQVAEALHYMHEQTIIHCDIKPENIFLCRSAGEGRRRPAVKLIDFGLSRTEVLDAKLAQSEVAGTPEYMAPELIRGCAPAPSVDIYSLGILLFHMITGQLPFAGELMDVVRAQLDKEPPSPSTLLGEPLDERVETLILKALAKNPEARQASMGQMIFEIRTLMDMLGIAHQRKRVAVERRPVGPELEGPRLAFDHCPCPLFRLDLNACLLAMNPAFCDFVREPPERLVGRPLTSTRLGPLYADLRSDLNTCAEQLMQIQHLISFKTKGAQRVAAALCWLVPELDYEDTCVSFTGIIVPCHSAEDKGP